MTKKSIPVYDISSRVFLITGGAGLMGKQHAMAVAEAGGQPILIDIDDQSAREVANEVELEHNIPVMVYVCDITDEQSLLNCRNSILKDKGRIDGLINNAANNEKMEEGAVRSPTSLDDFPLQQWEEDLAIGITGAFLCSRVFGSYMAEHEGGVIVNISSDMGLIAPDQRIYHKPGLPDSDQAYKPVSYSVVKHAVIGLTKYLATYWATNGVRVNALCPGGIYSGQSEDLVEKLTNLIPLGRMATKDEYRGAIQFLCSDASLYMNGTCLVIDGGRSVW